MKKKIILGLALALSVIPLANAPSKSLSKIEKIASKLEIEYVYPFNESEKVRELKNYYKQQIENEKNYVTEDFTKDKDEILLARMLLGEAEDCSKIEKIAIAYSVINRKNKNPERYGKTLNEVILKPRQYSAFNDDRNKKLKKPLDYNKNEFLENLELSKEIIRGKYKDPTRGATHYFNPNHPDTRKKFPDWAKRLKKIGRIKNSHHVFYK